MQKIFTTALAISVCFASCTNNSQTKNQNSNMEKTTLPTAKEFVSSPIRNRLKLELNSTVNDVWAVVGDPSRMPEYSNGLDSVETKKDEKGNCKEFICHFKPMQQGEQSILFHSYIKWIEPNKGWASVDEEPNAFGLTNSLTLITFTEESGKTILSWEQYYNAQDLEMNKAGFEKALTEIGTLLTKRFGGKILESFVEGKSK